VRSASTTTAGSAPTTTAAGGPPAATAAHGTIGSAGPSANAAARIAALGLDD
jgi:hypothetical protein